MAAEKPHYPTREATPRSQEDGDEIRGADVFYRLCDLGSRSRQSARGTRVRVGLGAGALAYPDLAQIAVSRRRRPAETVLRRNGPVCVAYRRGSCRDKAE